MSGMPACGICHVCACMPRAYLVDCEPPCWNIDVVFVLSGSLSSDLNPRNTTDWRRDFRAHKRDVQVYDNMPIGKIEAFNETSDNWNAYVEWVEQYFIANDIKEDKQVAVILSLMGNKMYGLLRNLSARAKPSSLSLKTIVETLQKHLSPKPLLITKRFCFHKRNQLVSK